MITCDTHNDEYFESHYQLSHGLFNNRFQQYYCQNLLFRRCQKDPLNPDADYKHQRVLLTPEGEYCPSCESRTPLSLKILSCNVILKHKAITMVGVSSLPGQLIKFLMEVGLNVQDDWYVIKSSMSVLLEYWPYKELDLTTLTDKGWFQVALMRLVLDGFASEIDSGALKKPYQLCEFVMKTSDEQDEFGFYHKLHRKLFSTLCREQRRWVFDHVEPTMKYIITTDIHIGTDRDVHRILYLLHLSRKPGSPFEIRIVNWHVQVVSISALAKISREINPEMMKSFSTWIRPEEILKLDEMLKPCVEMTSLSLTLYAAERSSALQQKLANDLSLLIGHHPTLKRLVLRNFEDHLVRYWDINCLPTSLEILEVYDSILMRVDVEHSTASHIRHLTISSFLRSESPSDVEGYLKFVESHAETLVSLIVNLSTNEHQPTVDSLKRMAKRLAQFHKLQSFRYHVRKVEDLLEILHGVMPLIAQSLVCYELISDSVLPRYDRDFIESLQLAMKTICMGRERPLDCATVIFQVRDVGIPTVENEEPSEVLGHQCYSPDDCDCKYDMEEMEEYFDFEDGIPNDYDFHDDIPIGQYKDGLPVPYAA